MRKNECSVQRIGSLPDEDRPIFCKMSLSQVDWQYTQEPLAEGAGSGWSQDGLTVHWNPGN
ncbi:MAG: hypothetical protein N2B57_00370 [Planctomycetales bacterium]